MPPSPSKPRNSPKNNFRQFNEAAGRRGEFLAALFLQMQGYRIIGRRVKTPVGEIDLIARRGDTIAIVEVKARSFSHQETEALLAVNQRRIIRAARFWLTGKTAMASAHIRFDVIFLAPFAWPRHIVNAFDASGIA